MEDNNMTLDMSKITSIAYPNGKQIVSIKDADGKVLWSASSAYERPELFLLCDESVFISKRDNYPYSRAIVRGGCSVGDNTQTPENPAALTCNNGEVQFVDGVLTISGSPSTFDYNENRLNPVDLFGWGYADEQNVLTGVITRKVQVSAMRASWDWVQQSVSGATYFALPKSSYPLLVCTHFHQVSTATPANVGEWCEGSGDYLLFNYNGTNDNLADFEDYLEECYQANEAVICLTKRFVDVTENETPIAVKQELGVNTIKYAANDNSVIAVEYLSLFPANNEMWYVSATNAKLTFANSFDGISEISNVYANGYGIVKYSGNVVTMIDQQFRTQANLKYVWFPQSLTQLGANGLLRIASLRGVFFAANTFSATPRAWSEEWTGMVQSKIHAVSNGTMVEYFLNRCNAMKLVDILLENVSTNLTANDFKNNICHTFVLRTSTLHKFNTLAWKNSTIRSYTIVYVPQSLLATYKAEPLWAGTLFFPIPDCWL